MTTLDELMHKRTGILRIASRYGASNVRVFGSVVHGEDTQNSDIDILVDMQQGCSLLDLVGLQQDLQRFLGRKIDVLTERGINPYLKDRILAEARPL